jgi:hypothetical protein
MALNFPNSPVDGQIYDNYYWDAEQSVWNSLGNYDIPNLLSNGTFTSSGSSITPLTVKGAPSQAANLQEWKNNSDITLASLSASGGLTLNNALAVANGGTGSTLLTSGAYLKGAGTNAITAQVGIPKSDIPAPVASTSRYTAGGILTTSYATYVTVTITATGRPVVVNMSAVYSNANSSANRTVDFRVQMGGVTIGEELTGLYSPWVSGIQTPLSTADNFLVTPASGSRTFTLQAKASNVSSVGLFRASLTVVEL